MNWRDGARIAEDETKAAFASLSSAGHALANSPSVQFFAAVGEYARGKPSELIDWLRSARELPPDFRECLILLFEGKFWDGAPKKRGRGRPPEVDLHVAAFAARLFYGTWLKANAERNIKALGIVAK